jgi:hypothetical protein
MAFGWKLYGGDGRSPPPPGEVVKPDQRLTSGRMVGIGARHRRSPRDPDRLPGALPGKRSTGRITG